MHFLYVCRVSHIKSVHSFFIVATQSTNVKNNNVVNVGMKGSI